MAAPQPSLNVPTIGIVPLFRMMSDFRRDALDTFARLAREHGDVVRFKGLWTSYLLTNPDHVEHVLQTNSRNYRKGRIYKELIPSTGEGLFVTDGETWLRQRRLAQPAFHKQKVAAFTRVMSQATEEMLERWRPAAKNGTPISVDAEMTRLTLGIVTRSLLSRDLSDEADAMNRSFEVIRTFMMHRLTSFVKLPVGMPFPRNRQFRKAIADADRLVYNIIAERRRGGGSPDDLLSLLMAATDEDTGERMSDKELRDQALTIIGAGYETTTQALAWTWYLLARHPHAEERLHCELAEVLDGRTPTFEDLPKLRYTLSVFQESMRLYPPAWMLSRTAIVDDEIGGHPIAAGSEMLLMMFLTHRDPRYWDRPDDFDPDRFSAENSDSRARFAYYPFGGGPRQCIGNAFALMEAQVIIAAVAQKYRLRPATDKPIEAEPSVTLRPRGGVTVTLEARN